MSEEQDKPITPVKDPIDESVKEVSDVNKIIAELEEDMKIQKEKLYTETKDRVDKEYSKTFEEKNKTIDELKSKLGTIESQTKEETQKIIDNYKLEMKEKFDAIEKELSARKSVIPDQKNPFRQTDELKKDWMNDPNLTQQEKYAIFERTALSKK